MCSWVFWFRVYISLGMPFRAGWKPFVSIRMTLHTGPSKTNSHRPPESWCLEDDLYIFPFGALGLFFKGCGGGCWFQGIYSSSKPRVASWGQATRIPSIFNQLWPICGVQFGGELPLAVLFETHMMQIQPRKNPRLKPKKSFYKNLQASRHLQGGLPIKENKWVEITPITVGLWPHPFIRQL